MNFDDESLNRPPLVNWTPTDMYDARPYVAAVTCRPLEMIDEAAVWSYRFGYTNAEDRDFDPFDVNEVNRRDRDRGIGVVHTDSKEGDLSEDDFPNTDERGTTMEELVYGNQEESF
jgi:hypothetical protein